MWWSQDHRLNQNQQLWKKKHAFSTEQISPSWELEHFHSDDNTERQQVIRLLESQSVEIQRNQKQADNLKDALDELDYLRLLESVELAEQQVF